MDYTTLYVVNNQGKYPEIYEVKARFVGADYYIDKDFTKLSTSVDNKYFTFTKSTAIILYKDLCNKSLLKYKSLYNTKFTQYG